MALDVRHNQLKSNIYFLLPFKTMVIMASWSFFPHMNAKELRVKIHLIQF
jgi:TRAP-type mannitol/chloroaromatic compound transport system permease small subunit